MNWGGLVHRRRIGFDLFLLAYFLLALFTYKSYGITWDEWDWYISGEEYLKHFLHMVPAEQDHNEIFSDEQASHNYLYPALARAFNHYLEAENLHRFNMFFALFAFWVLFEVLLDAFQNSWLALLGPLTLYLTLRFSGDIPANPKDMPFAVLYLCSLAALYFYRRVPWNKLSQDFILGSLFGWTACVRVLGLTLLPVFLFFRLLDYYELKRSGSRLTFLNWAAEEGPHWGLLFIVSQFWMMALWPYLGSNYFGNYPKIFTASKNFSWDGGMLFMGNTIHAGQKLWYYLPGWFLVSMPLFALAFFLFSHWVFLKTERPRIRRAYLIFAVPFFLNLGLYLVLKPVIYNGLRHYLFLVPLFCALAAVGLAEFWNKAMPSLWKRGILLLVALNVGSILGQFVQLFPYQYIYLNELTGGVRGGALKFDTDYWGASLKEAAQWLQAHELTDPKKNYQVQTDATVWQETYYFSSNVKGGGPQDVRDPDYRIALYYRPLESRVVLTPSPEDQKRIIHVVEREGFPLAYVFKMK
ncbi:MAG TPA: hypothetical protein VMV05_08785 [bacterium]|nr:hypothetical protein [bacterium]